MGSDPCALGRISGSTAASEFGVSGSISGSEPSVALQTCQMSISPTQHGGVWDVHGSRVVKRGGLPMSSSSKVPSGISAVLLI